MNSRANLQPPRTPIAAFQQIPDPMGVEIGVSDVYVVVCSDGTIWEWEKKAAPPWRQVTTVPGSPASFRPAE